MVSKIKQGFKCKQYSSDASRRVYTPKEKWGNYEELLRELYRQRKSQNEMIACLAAKGFHTNSSNLKYVLRTLGISKRNRTARHRDDMQGDDIEHPIGNPSVSESELDAEGEDVRPGLSHHTPADDAFGLDCPVPLDTISPLYEDTGMAFKAAEPVSFATNLANNLQHLDAEGEPTISEKPVEQTEIYPLDNSARASSEAHTNLLNPVPKIYSEDDSLVDICLDLAGDFEKFQLDSKDEETLSRETFDHITSDPEICSAYYREYYDDWIRRRKVHADQICQIYKTEMSVKGVDEFEAYNHLTQTFPRPPWGILSVGFEVEPLPLSVYKSFLQPYTGPDKSSVEKSLMLMQESQTLKQIFVKHFKGILELGLRLAKHSEQQDYELKSQALQVLTIEREFGPTSCLLIQAMFQLESLIYQLGFEKSCYDTTPKINLFNEDIITISNLILAKLERLGLRHRREAIRPLTHITQARDSMGDTKATLETSQLCRQICGLIGMPDHNDLHQTREMIQHGKALCATSYIDSGICLLKEASERLSTAISRTDLFRLGTSHGFFNLAQDLFSIASTLDESKGAGETFSNEIAALAIQSYEKALGYFEKAGVKYQYMTVNGIRRRLGPIYVAIGDYGRGLKNYHESFTFRTKTFGIADHEAAQSMQAIANIMDTKGYLFFLQPMLWSIVFAPAREKDETFPIYYDIYYRASGSIDNVDIWLTSD